MMPFDTCIVLSHELTTLGKLNEQSLGRIGRGIQLLLEGRAKTLTLTGGYSFLADNGTTVSEQMRNYAIAQGVDSGSICLEELSRDTVGNAFFTKVLILDPHRLRRFCVVTNRYHEKRARQIFGFMYNIAPSEIPFETIDIGLTEAQKYHEEKSLEAFLTTFGGLTPGDDEAILQRLFSEHPYYRGNSEIRQAFDRRLKNLK